MFCSTAFGNIIGSLTEGTNLYPPDKGLLEQHNKIKHCKLFDWYFVHTVEKVRGQLASAN